MKFEELPERLQAVIPPGYQSDHLQIVSDVWDREDEEGKKDLVELFRNASPLDRDSLILRLSQRLLHQRYPGPKGRVSPSGSKAHQA